MKQKPRLQVGDRVRAKVRTMCGWKGTGAIVGIAGNLVTVRMDGMEHPNDTAGYMDYQLARMRTPKQ